MSHACARCGLELSGVRAPPDPIYKLAVVVCPRCQLAVVRVKPRVEHAFRRARRCAISWIALVVQAALALGFARVILGASGHLHHLVRVEWKMPWSSFGGSLVTGQLAGKTGEPDALAQAGALMALFVVASVAAGVWLAIGCAHHARCRVMLGWVGVLGACVIVPWAFVSAVLRLGIPHPFYLEPPGAWPSLGGAVISAGLAQAGHPVGQALSALWRTHKQQRRSLRRRRIRETRTVTA